MGMEAAHAAAAKALDDGGASLADSTPPPEPLSGPSDADISAAVEQTLADLNPEQPGARKIEPKSEPKEPEQDPWAEIKEKYRPEEFAAAMNDAANARAALREANIRNRRAAQLEEKSLQNLDGLIELASRDEEAAVKVLRSFKTSGRTSAEEESDDGIADALGTPDVRLPRSTTQRDARMKNLESRVQAFEVNNFVNGVRNVVQAHMAKEPIFGELEVTNDVLNNLVTAITSDRNLPIEDIDRRARELVAESAKHTRKFKEKIEMNFVKSNGVAAKNTPPVTRGAGGTPPRADPKLPRIGQGGNWKDIHKFASAFQERLRQAGGR